MVIETVPEGTGDVLNCRRQGSETGIAAAKGNELELR